MTSWLQYFVSAPVLPLSVLVDIPDEAQFILTSDFPFIHAMFVFELLLCLYSPQLF